MKKFPYNIPVMQNIQRNDATMAGRMQSAEHVRHDDWCCGIHGAARWRKGTKRGTSAARRRYEKTLLKGLLEDAE